MLHISFGPEDDLQGASASCVAVLTDAGFAEGAVFRRLDGMTQGALSRAVEAAGFKGDRQEVCSVLAPAVAFSRIVLVGCGAEVRPGDVEVAGAVAARTFKSVTRVMVAFDGAARDHALRAGLGAILGQYRFTKYQTKGEAAPTLTEVSLLVEYPDRAEWSALEALARGVIEARDLVSEPPNVLSPEVFVERIGALRELGVEIEVLDAPKMRDLGFGALLGVAQGSDNAPRTVLMRYRNTAEQGAPLAFVGKGVTFDSGGYSLKPAGSMEEMKTDMAGAAAVVGAIHTLAARKAKVDVIGVVGLVENMVSGGAMRPGDVVTSHSGQTIEVLNTDAEGRLVLADLLSYTRERFAPALMVDLATLTGAIVVSLGYHHAGLFANDDALAVDLTAAGLETGEALWRMPMGPDYDKALRSPIADMKNIGGRPGGSITAAQFLARFVGDTPWAHLDIAGTAWSSDAKPTSPKGATGFGVRLLDALVRRREERAVG